MAEVETLAPVAQDPEVKRLESDAAGFLALANELVVNESTVQNATDLLSYIARTKKLMDERRQFFVRPLNEHVKRINEWFRERLAPLDQADNVVRKKVLDFRQEQERIRREQEAEAQRLAEEQAKLLAAQAAARGEPAPEPPPPPPAIPEPPKTIRSALGSSTVREVWAFEIVDESQIPRSFLMPNERAIRAAVQAGTREIPGVRIFKDQQLSVRAR